MRPTKSCFAQWFGLGVALIGAILALNGLQFSAFAQGNTTPIPLVSLVPPTLVPPPPTPTPLPPISRSALARILARDTQNKPPTPIVVVGMPFNLKGFVSITDTGDKEGFEADLARAIAEDWGAKIEFRQVTKENALDALKRGDIDLLMGQQILSRDTQDVLDYSDPIFVGSHVALALASNPVNQIQQLGGQAVGVVIGSASEAALKAWMAATNIQPQIKSYVMLDDGLRDLSTNSIVAMIGDRVELHQRVFQKIEGVKVLRDSDGQSEGVFRTDPYAIAMLRYDETLRTLVNRTLQRLASSNRLAPIYDRWFKSYLGDGARVTPRVWKDLDKDQRTLDKFPVDIVQADRPLIQRIKAGDTLHVAGFGAPPGPDGQASALDKFNTALMLEMARRWGAKVELIPNSYANAEDLLASGAADLAIGLEPRWGPVERIDYAGIYAERGYKMIVRVKSGITGFASLQDGRRVIATYADDANAFEIARKLAISVGIPEAQIQNVKVNTDQDAIDAVFGQQTARMLFADSMRAIPVAAANKPYVDIVDKLYEPRPLAFGVPRNDADFRVLVEVTLQEMVKDGTYVRLWNENWNAGDPLHIIIWPGAAQIFGLKTTG